MALSNQQKLRTENWELRQWEELKNENWELITEHSKTTRQANGLGNYCFTTLPDTHIAEHASDSTSSQEKVRQTNDLENYSFTMRTPLQQTKLNDVLEDTHIAEHLSGSTLSQKKVRQQNGLGNIFSNFAVRKLWKLYIIQDIFCVTDAACH